MYFYHLVRIILPTGKATTVSLDPILAAKAARHFGGPRNLNRFVRNAMNSFDGNGRRSHYAAQAVQQALEAT